MADEDELSALSRANSLASLPRTPLPGPTTVVPVDTYVTLSNGVKMPTIGCTCPKCPAETDGGNLNNFSLQNQWVHFK